MADDSCYRIDAPGFALVNSGNAIDSCNAANAATSADPNGFLFATIVESPNSVVISRISATPAATGSVATALPYVDNVANVLNEAATPTGQLDSAVTTSLVIDFSEPLTYTASTAFPIEVEVGTPPNVTAATVSSVTDSGNALTITLASALPAGTPVLVNLPVEAFVDATGNFLTSASHVSLLALPAGCAPSYGGSTPPFPPEAAACGDIPTAVGFDSLISIAGIGTVDQLNLMTLGTVTTTAPAATLAQVFAEAPGVSANDLAGFGTTSALVTTVDTTKAATATDSNGDTVTSPGGNDELVQLNSQLGSTLFPPVLPVGSAQLWLTLLDLELLKPTTTQLVLTNIARVTVTLPSPVQDVVLSSQRNGLPQDVLFFPVDDGQGLPTETVLATGKGAVASTSSSPLGNGSLWYVFTPPAGVSFPYSFDVEFSGDGGSGVYGGGYSITGAGHLTATTVATGVVNPGDSLVAWTRASGGLVGSEAAATLVDEVPPTVTVQFPIFTIDASGSLVVGAGGGVLSTSGATGTVIYPISPQSGDVVYTGAASLATDTFQDDLLEVGNTAYAGGVDTGYIDTEVTSFGLNSSYKTTSALADATSTAAYLNTEVSHNTANYVLGVDVDEPVNLVTGGTPTYTGTNATLSNYKAGGSLNLASGKGLAGVIDVNLVSFAPSSLLGLQADGRAEATLSFTGAIQDLAATPNVADTAANAVVQLRDFFPPLMVAGFFDGTNFVFDFDEPVQLAGHISFGGIGNTCNPANIDLTFPPAPITCVGAITLTTGTYGANTRVKVPYTNFTSQDAGVHVLDCFTLPQYAEAEYSPTGPLAAAINLPAADIAATPVHGGVAYEDVPDTANNSDLNYGNGTGANIWHGFSTTAVTGSWDDQNEGLTLPLFAMADLLGPFEIVAAYNPAKCPGIAGGLTSFQCTFLFTQPVFFGIPSVAPAAANEDFDGLNAYNGQPSINDVHTAAASTTLGDLAAYCAEKFNLWAAGTPPTPKAHPDYCVPVNSAGTPIASTGGVYTPAVLAQAYGLEAFWGSVAPLGTATTTTDLVTFNDNGTAATSNNFFVANMSTISSAFYAGTFSVSNYTTQGFTGTPSGLTLNGVVVANNHNNPINTLFELTELNP